MMRYLIGCLLLASPALGMTAELYVQSAKADLMAQPNFNAEVLATVPKGEQLEVASQQGPWVKVSYQDQQGWMAAMLVDDNPPMDKTTVLDEHAESLEQNSRQRASNMTTAGATRGLSPKERSRLSAENQADFEALERMEAVQVSTDEALQFLRHGLR